MQLETDRLILREFAQSDFDALYAVLSDPEAMKFYPKPFDEARVRGWIQWNLENYRVFGFGLWAVVLKSGGEVIGDCGVTMQNINGIIKPEIGYHIRRDHQNHGYASEAARKCRDYIFENTPFNSIYSYMKATNAASAAVAIHCGMRLVDEYADPVNTLSRAYAITRAEWMRIAEKSDRSPQIR